MILVIYLSLMLKKSRAICKTKRSGKTELFVVFGDVFSFTGLHAPLWVGEILQCMVSESLSEQTRLSQNLVDGWTVYSQCVKLWPACYRDSHTPLLACNKFGKSCSQWIGKMVWPVNSEVLHPRGARYSVLNVINLEWAAVDTKRFILKGQWPRGNLQHSAKQWCNFITQSVTQ